MTRVVAFFLALLLVPVALAQEVQPIVITELEKTEAIPGQPILLRVTVLAPTWFPKPPVFPSFEVPNVMVRLPERASRPTSERLGGETWSGVTRTYRLTPMLAGRFTIPPRTLTVTYANPETRAPATVTTETEAIRFEGFIPPGAEGLDPFIAATALALEQTIDGDPADLAPGDAFTRTVTARIEGISPIFLPPFIPALETASLAAYPDEPILSESVENGVPLGSRVERVTYVAEAGGRFNARPVTLRWYNLETGEVEETDVPGFEIAARGPLPAAEPQVDWRAILPWIAAGLLLAATVRILLGRLWPRIVSWRERRRKTYRASEAYAFHEAARALKARRLDDALNAIDLWCARCASTPDVTGLNQALMRLGNDLYGSAPSHASGKDWSAALAALNHAQRTAVAVSTKAPQGSKLVPLNPGRAV